MSGMIGLQYYWALTLEAAKPWLTNVFITLMWGNMIFAFLNAVLWKKHGKGFPLAGKNADVMFSVGFNILMNMYAVTYGYNVRPVYNTGIWPYWLGQLVMLSAQIRLWKEFTGR